MQEQDIEHVIAEIMIQCGPDGHCDGAEVIAAFVSALLHGEDEEWLAKFRGQAEGGAE